MPQQAQNVRTVVYLPPELHSRALAHDDANLRLGMTGLVKLALAKYLDDAGEQQARTHPVTNLDTTSRVSA